MLTLFTGVLSLTTPAMSVSVHSGLPVALLDQAKTPVWGKLGVACNQEVEVQLQVKLAVGSGVDIC